MSLSPYNIATEGARAGHKIFAKLGFGHIIDLILEALWHVDPRYVIRKLRQKLISNLSTNSKVAIEERNFTISKLK